MIILELLIDIVFYNLGFWLIRIVTLGKYPKEHDITEGVRVIAFIGTLVFILVVFIFSYLIY